MLATARRVTWAERYVRSGGWITEGQAPLTRRVHGKTLGIVGLGSIGRAVAKRAAGFGTDIAYHGPAMKHDVPYRYYANVADMARDVDFLVVTASGAEGIVNAAVRNPVAAG